jgi:hypothetical protein
MLQHSKQYTIIRQICQLGQQPGLEHWVGSRQGHWVALQTEIMLHPSEHLRLTGDD